MIKQWRHTHVTKPTVCGDGFQEKEEREGHNQIADPVDTGGQRCARTAGPQRVDLRVDGPGIRTKACNSKQSLGDYMYKTLHRMKWYGQNGFYMYCFGSGGEDFYYMFSFNKLYSQVHKSANTVSSAL